MNQILDYESDYFIAYIEFSSTILNFLKKIKIKAIPHRDCALIAQSD